MTTAGSRPSGARVRVAVLWQQMSGYARACFAALADKGADVLVVSRDPTPDAPYEQGEVGSLCAGESWSSAPDERGVRRRVEAFGPDVLLVCSWNVGAYRRISRAMRGRTLRVLFMDNPWRGTAKQWAGRAIAPAAIRPAYDVAFLPAERQAEFARRLGFADDRILWGAYTCDTDTFAAVARQGAAAPRRFIFVGRLTTAKGIDVLLEAYRSYRRAAGDPWPLVVCGTGPLSGQLAAVPGVEWKGFVQPSALPGLLAESACLVLPSRFEPWGVVVHEATTAGLAVVCTTACGASDRLVLDGYNGAVVAPGDAASLARALIRVGQDGADADAMGRRGQELAAQFSPARWAAYLLSRSLELREELGLDVAVAGASRGAGAPAG